MVLDVQGQFDVRDQRSACRMYTIHVAGETVILEANPDDAVIKVIEEIYKSAVKPQEDQP
jgi:hypothetical protein